MIIRLLKKEVCVIRSRIAHEARHGNYGNGLFESMESEKIYAPEEVRAPAHHPLSSSSVSAASSSAPSASPAALRAPGGNIDSMHAPRSRHSGVYCLLSRRQPHL